MFYIVIKQSKTFWWDEPVPLTHRTSGLWAWSLACRTGRLSCSPGIWDRLQSSPMTRGSWTVAAWPASASAGWSAAPASAADASGWRPRSSRSSIWAEGCLLREWTKIRTASWPLMVLKQNYMYPLHILSYSFVISFRIQIIPIL